jgi:hypothetical protein
MEDYPIYQPLASVALRATSEIAAPIAIPNFFGHSWSASLTPSPTMATLPTLVLIFSMALTFLQEEDCPLAGVMPIILAMASATSLIIPSKHNHSLILIFFKAASVAIASGRATSIEMIPKYFNLDE